MSSKQEFNNPPSRGRGVTRKLQRGSQNVSQLEKQAHPVKSFTSSYKTKEDHRKAISKKISKILDQIKTKPDHKVRFLNQDAMKIWVKAFTHDSIDQQDNYEVLELLGDRVLDLYFLDYFQRSFPGQNQDTYSNNVQYYQSKESQSILSDSYEFFQLLAIDQEQVKEVNELVKVKSDVFESFFGALFTIANSISDGLGGVYVFNTIIYMYEEVELSVRSKEISKPKTVLVQMFQKFNIKVNGELVKLSELITTGSKKFSDQYSNSEFWVVLPASIVRFLSNNGISLDDLDKLDNGAVIIGHGKNQLRKISEREAYLQAYDNLSSRGFYYNKATELKWNRDVSSIDEALVSKAVSKAKQRGLILEFYTLINNNLIGLRGVDNQGRPHNLKIENSPSDDSIVIRRERLLREYIK